MSENTITIDGRRFHGVTQELSALQDQYLIGQLRLAGALEVLTVKVHKTAAVGPSSVLPGVELADPEQTAASLLTQIMISGRASHVLAGCLTEEGKSWTVGEAERNAALFAGITSSEDKRAMTDALLGFVLGFFQYATASVATFRKSSSHS